MLTLRLRRTQVVASVGAHLGLAAAPSQTTLGPRPPLQMEEAKRTFGVGLEKVGTQASGTSSG